MANSLIKKSIILTLTVFILCGQVYAQRAVAVSKNLNNFNVPSEARDNTRMYMPRLDAALSAAVDKPVLSEEVLSSAADRMTAITADGFKNAREFDEFNKIANETVSSFYDIASGRATVSEELAEKAYFIILQLIWANAVLQDDSYYAKIQNLYQNVYDACAAYKQNCEIEKAGGALLFLDGQPNKTFKLEDIAAILKNEKIEEEKRMNFLQSAAPVLFRNGGNIHYKNMVYHLAKRGDGKGAMHANYVNWFAIVEAFDGIYQFQKNAADNVNGVWAGFSRQLQGNKPFVMYKKPSKTPEYIENLLKKYDPATLDMSHLLMGKPKDTSLLILSLRLYGEIYSDHFDKDAFDFLFNFNGTIVHTDNFIEAHKNLALSSMVLKATSNDFGYAELKALKNYFAVIISNSYFAVEGDLTIEEELKASLKNELGQMYVKLTGYRGGSPIRVVSEDGFTASINFEDNERYIKGFWGNLFDFKEKPAESFANIFIISSIVKGTVQNGDKIVAGISRIFSNTKYFLTNMPSILARSKAQYKAMQYLASKNSMGTFRYAYNNAVYRSASRTAAKAGLTHVEGQKAAEFFSSSHYVPSAHGAINRTAKDIKQAATLGLTGLGKGGSVPSFVSEREFTQGLSSYSADLQRQQQLRSNIVSQYKNVQLSSAAGGNQSAALASLDEAAHMLPKSFLYSPDKAKYLSAAQNSLFSKDYLFRNSAYKFVQDRGIKFINLDTGRPFGDFLKFHPEGFMQASGRVGVINTNTFSKAAPALSNAYQAGSAKIAELAAKTSVMMADIANTFNKHLFDNTLNFAQKVLSPRAVFTSGRAIGATIPGGYSADIVRDATVKIERYSEGGGYVQGSGIYINYRGLPMIITAAHVVGKNKAVTFYDYFNNRFKGTVFNRSNIEIANDYAVIIPDTNFATARRTPLRLSRTEPEVGQEIYAFGYPSYSRWLVKTTMEMEGTALSPDNSDYSAYMASPALYGGNSGGVVTNDDGDMVGIAHMSVFDTGNSFLLTLPGIKNFLKETFKLKFRDRDFDQKTFFKTYPDLMRNYSNIISRYSSYMGRKTMPANTYDPIEKSTLEAVDNGN